MQLDVVQAQVMLKLFEDTRLPDPHLSRHPNHGGIFQIDLLRSGLGPNFVQKLIPEDIVGILRIAFVQILGDQRRLLFSVAGLLRAKDTLAELFEEMDFLLTPDHTRRVQVTLLRLLRLDFVLFSRMLTEKPNNFSSTLEPPGGVFLEKIQDRLAQILRMLLHMNLEEIRTAHILNAGRMKFIVVQLMRQLTIGNLVQRHSERIKVGTMIRRLSRNDLGGKIVQRPLDYIGKGTRDSLCQSEVDQLDTWRRKNRVAGAGAGAGVLLQNLRTLLEPKSLVASDEDIIGLDVEVYVPTRVDVFESSTGLDQNFVELFVVDVLCRGI